MKKTLLASAIFVSATTGAFGQTSDPIDDILVCQQIADQAARLACFDAAAVQLAAERDNGLVGIYRDDIEAVERDAFGFDLPSMPSISLSMFSGRGNSPDPLDPSTTPERLAANEPAPALQPATPAEPARRDAETNVAANTAEPVRDEAEEERRSLISRIPGFGGRRESTEPSPAAQTTSSQAINGVQVVERNNEGGVERIVMEIERIREIAYGRHRFYMTNGQVWVQSGTERFRYDEDANNFAEIRRASWGSYFLQINGEGRALRVQRER
ncbi:hypothetical protein V0U79_11580 [Hyphobacterium sp. HN65]|uniref:Uncharacterized protein n=1 Tax=Hyphobacterium lacteum TaxID=3116575 RepID=A0ABU7LTN9_9PROT|nr:hypothetical protein [Hyphobacterium sp. HN65]MEE2527011.1 hypothetical protein [Hyphobacterium sp. HN65]